MTESDQEPLNEFSGCHEGIIKNFSALGKLVDIHAVDQRDSKLKPMARELLEFFAQVVLQHHAEEEEELFSAVTKSAKPGVEAEQAQEAIDKLTGEHRELERMWSTIELDLRRLAEGKAANLDRQLAAELSAKYLDHAQYEEQVFLPLSAQILSQSDMAALGLSLHMRHNEPKLVPFI